MAPGNSDTALPAGSEPATALQPLQPARAEIIDLCSESVSDVDVLHTAGEVSSPAGGGAVSQTSDRGAADGTVTSVLPGPPPEPSSEGPQADLALHARPPGSSAAAGAGRAAATSAPGAHEDSLDTSPANSSSIISIGRAYCPEPADSSDASQGPLRDLQDDAHLPLHLPVQNADGRMNDTPASQGCSGAASELGQGLGEGLQRQQYPSTGVHAATTPAATSTRPDAAKHREASGAWSRLSVHMLLTQLNCIAIAHAASVRSELCLFKCCSAEPV